MFSYFSAWRTLIPRFASRTMMILIRLIDAMSAFRRGISNLLPGKFCVSDCYPVRVIAHKRISLSYQGFRHGTFPDTCFVTFH